MRRVCGAKIMHIIETQHKRVPWRWVVLIVLLGIPNIIPLFASGSLTFSMKKFIDSPAVINGLSSLDFLFKVLVSATCLYLSDRIWTRRGRRTPFIIAAWICMAVCFFFIPLAGGAWTLVPLVVLLLVATDVGATFQSLQMEIIPPDQRGRFSAMWQIVFQLLILLFGVVVGGRFDATLHRGDAVVRGEQTIYWLAALFLVIGIVFVWFFIRERRPTEAPPDHGAGIKGVFGNLLGERRLWPVYLLAFSQTLITTGLGAIDPLLMTEQWGYTKQDLGTNCFVGGMINLCILPFIAYFADRMNRIKMFVGGVVCALVLQIAYYVFVQFVLPDHRPTLVHIIIFGEAMSICGLFANTAFLPMLFDYIPRNQMGTAQAGLNFVNSITRLLTLNGVGLWVAYYARLFLPAGKYDYFSAYLFIIILNLVGCGLILHFVRQIRRGVIQPLGKIEFRPVENGGNGGRS